MSSTAEDLFLFLRHLLSTHIYDIIIFIMILMNIILNNNLIDLILSSNFQIEIVIADCFQFTFQFETEIPS